MKIIFDNIIFDLQRSGGGSVYWFEIVKRFLNSKLDFNFIDSRNKDNNIFRNKISLHADIKDVGIPITLKRFLPFRFRLKTKTIFHSSYYRIHKSKNAINVTTLHDFTPEYYFTGLSKLISFYQKRYAIKNSKGIICISENTKSDLLKFHPNAINKQIRVIYNGVSDSFYKVDRNSNSLDNEVSRVLEMKYILYVGHRTKYKNFDIAVLTLSELVKRGFHFVIVGEQLNYLEKSILDKYLTNSEYTVLSQKGNEDLNLIYNNAFCLLYPSSYEGFGIPILEAMKAGCPVVTTNKSSIPEVAGDAAIMVEYISPSSFEAAINQLENEDFRNDLISKGFVQSLKFSWDKTYDEVLNFYRFLYAKK